MPATDLRSRLDRCEREVEREVGEAQALVRSLRDLQARSEERRAYQEACDRAVAVLSSYADVRQAEVHARVEDLVTSGLQTIFEDDLRFRVIQEVRARRVETRFAVVSTVGGEEVETDVLNSRGGGVACVVGFLLRLLVVLLKDEYRPFLFLDETFSQLSSGYEPRLAQFLRELVDRTDCQLVLVTHSETYAEFADRVYRLSLVKGATKVEEIT